MSTQSKDFPDGVKGAQGPQGDPGTPGITRQFKTLAEARTAYETLETETALLRQQIQTIPGLEAQIAEKTAFGSETATENQNLRDLIVQKDGEIAVLKAENLTHSNTVSEFQNKLQILEKGQKTVKQAARELVAATGGPPIAIDHAEAKKSQVGSEKEFLQAMMAEQDPVKLGELYREYNEQFRSKKKT